MQLFNIITNIFTIIGSFVGCCMFYFTFKNHKWLVEDRKKQIEEEIKKKLNTIFSIIAENSIANSGINKILLPQNIIKSISNYNIPQGVIDFINKDIEKEIHNEFILQTNNYKNITLQIIQQYRNGTRLNDIDFNKLRSLFKNNNEISSIYNKISNK
jgi:H2-forming N5,N10-methylenetetrahydromethanopterin dehydrogenase-like enzyme